jgi:DNA-binding beta-propeller fold protein YncE
LSYIHGEKQNGLANNNDTYLSQLSNSSNYQDYINTSLINTIELPSEVESIVINPNSKLLYTNHPSLNYSYIISQVNNTILGKIELPGFIKNLAVDPEKNMIYSTTAFYDVSEVNIIDGTNNKIVSNITIPNGYYPDGFDLDLNPKINKLYVTASEDNKVYRINTLNYTDIKQIIVPDQPMKVSIDLKNNVVYVLHTNNDTISIIDGNNDELIDTINLGILSEDLTIDSEQNLIYVSTGFKNRNLIIDINNDYKFKRLVLPEEEEGTALYTSIAVNPLTDILYKTISDSGNIYLIDSNTFDYKPIYVGGSPRGIFIDVDSNKAYITDDEFNKIYILENITKDQIQNFNGNNSLPGLQNNNFAGKFVFNSNTGNLLVINNDLNKFFEININNKPEINELSIHNYDNASFSINDVYLDEKTYNLYIIKNHIGGGINNELAVINLIQNTSKSVVTLPFLREVVGDPSKNLIFVSGSDQNGNDLLHIINSSNYDIIGNLSIPYGGRIDYDPSLQLITSAGIDESGGYVVYVLWGSELKKIPITSHISDIIINKKTHLIYVIEQKTNRISIIDPYFDNIKPDNITVGHYPIKIAINENTNTIYVLNSGDNTISVIDGLHNKLIKNIAINPGIDELIVDPVKNIVYLFNTKLNILSLINGKTNNLQVGILFKIDPNNTGSIICGKEEIITNKYYYLDLNSICKIKPTDGYIFSHWSQNYENNSSLILTNMNNNDSWFNYFKRLLGFDIPSHGFDITQFGSFTANFRAAPEIIPREYVLAFYGFWATIFTGLILPNITGWIKSYLQTRRLRYYFKTLQILNRNSYKENYLDQLDNIKNEIDDAFAAGKINEIQYKILIEKISENKKKV